MSMIDEPMEREEVEIEERKPLTSSQKFLILDRQNSCCPACGGSLIGAVFDDRVTMFLPMIDEHIDPLWRGGVNDISNRALYCVPCAKAKTKKEAAQRAKVNRIRRRERGEEPAKQKIRSPGFRRDKLSPRNFR